MAIRVSQQYVSVFGETSSNTLVARQYIQVMSTEGSSDIPASASSTISFAQDARGLAPQRVSHDLSLSSVVVVVASKYGSASSTMTLSDTALKSFDVYASSTMNLEHFWFEFNYVADRAPADSVMALTQEATAFGSETVEHDLGITDAVEVRGPVLVATTSQMSLTEAMRNSSHNLRPSNTLVFVEAMSIPLPTQNVVTTMNLTDLAYMSFVDQVITFVQTASAGRDPGVEIQTISFTQTLTTGGTFRRTIVDDIGISHSLTYFEDTPCNRKNYTPFIGDGGSDAPPARLTDPQFDTSPGDAERFLLYYPARGARSTTVSIRAPQFGDRDRNAYTRVNRETRGGRLVVYSDPTWPQTRTMAVTIIGLTKVEVDEIQDLFYSHLGQLIGITDWEGYEWEGVVTDPEQPAVHDGKRGWTVTFQFEGAIIDGYSPGHDLGADDTAGDAIDPGANSPMSLVQELGGAQPAPNAPPGQSLGFTSAASATVVTP